MEIQIAVAKTSKYGSLESGDTLEVVERPTGGVSVVLVDALHSGKKAKAISINIVHHVISLLAEGVRDDAAARKVSNRLLLEMKGEVSAFLNILSVDLQANTLIITRNNPAPIFIAMDERIEAMLCTDAPIGVIEDVPSTISEIPLEADVTILMCTDGVVNSGARYGQSLDVRTLLKSLLEDQNPTSQQIADTVLSQAINLDQGRPDDDMSVVVLQVLNNNKMDDVIRRMTVRFPVVSSPFM